MYVLESLPDEDGQPVGSGKRKNYGDEDDDCANEGPVMSRTIMNTKANVASIMMMMSFLE